VIQSIVRAEGVTEAASVGVFAPRGSVDANAAAKNHVRPYLPAEAGTRHHDVVLGRLQSGAAVLADKSIPHAALHESARGNSIDGARGDVLIRYARVKGSHVAMCLRPAGHDFITQTSVDGESGLELPVVLDEQLRGLPTSTVFGCVVRGPLLRLAEEEVGIGETVVRGGVGAALRGVRAGEGHIRSGEIAPGG